MALGEGTAIVVSGNVSDVAGNAAEAFTKDGFVLKDTIAPSIDSVIVSADDVINSSDTLSAVAVSVSTTGVEDGQVVSLDIGGVTAEVAITSDGFDGTVDLLALGEGTAIVVSGNVSDVAGNAAEAFTKDGFVLKDTIAPSIDSVIVSADDVINSSDTLSAVAVSVSTTGVEDGQVISLDIGGVTAEVAITSDGFDGTVDLLALGEGTAIVVSGNVSDVAGNAAEAFTKDGFVLKDTIAPSIDSVIVSADDVINSSDTLSAVAVSVSTTGVEDGQVVSLDIGGVMADVAITNNGFDGTVDLSALGDGTAIAVSGNVSDVAGNAAEAFTKDGFVLKDTIAPSIDSVIVSADDVINSSDTLSAVAVSVSTTGVEDGQVISLDIGGVTAEVAITSDGFDGTVDLLALGEGTEIVVSGNVSDVAGNAAATFTKANSVIKDTEAPSIDSVSIDASDNTIYIVGDTIEVTITASDNDTGLVFSTKTFNGNTLDNGVENDNDGVTDNGNGTYTTTYTVADGHDDVDAGEAVTIALEYTDAAGNAAAGTYTLDTNLPSGTSIDANLPAISSITIDDGSYGIGDSVTVRIQAGDSEQGLTLKGDVDVDGNTDGTFNGQKLTGFYHVIGGKYEATYTVQPGDASVADGGYVATNIILADSAGNESETNTSIKLSGAYIDTEKPVITSVSMSRGTYKIDDDILLYIEISEVDISNTDLIVENTIYFNDQQLTDFSADPDDEKVYTATYTVTESDTDGKAGDNLSANIVLTDPAGNDSDPITQVTLPDKVTIDANRPVITALTISEDNIVNTTKDSDIDAVPFSISITGIETTDSVVALAVNSLNTTATYDSNSTTDSVTTFTFTGTIDLSSLSSDTTTATASATDAAGNAAIDFTAELLNDTTAPTIVTSGTDTSANEASTATLDASNSSDDLSGIASYAWKQVESGGTALQDSSTALTIDSNTSASTTVTTPAITDDTTQNLSFYFTVTVTDKADNNATSDVLTLTVTNTYTTPTITASPVGAPNFDQISLSWDADTSLSYSLYRSTNLDCANDLGSITNIASCNDGVIYIEGGNEPSISIDDSDTASITDTGLEFFTTYYYWLEAKLSSDEVVSLSSEQAITNSGPVLNDTGITGGGDYPSGFDNHNGLADGADGAICNGGYLVDDSGNVIADPDNHSGNSTFIAFDDEDCEVGRDATLNDDSDGNAAFVFTKLDISGNVTTSTTIGDWSCVLDHTTGLIWEVKTNDNTLRDRDESFTWYNSSTAEGTPSSQDTADFVEYVNGNAEVNSGNGLCGQTNWRLPTVRELVGISDFSTYEPVVDTSYFPNSRTGAFEWSWTADLNSDTVNLPGYAWLYSYYTGSTRSGGNSLGTTSNSFYVRLVSSSEAVKSYFNDYSADGGRYTDHEDGTVSDNRTGLMWMKCIYGQAHNSDDNSCGGTGAGAGGTWQEAFAKAAAINEGVGTFGYTDWRLPNMKELLSLVDLSSFQPPINQAIFPNTDGQSQWTSTLSAQDGGDAALAVGLGADPEFGLLGKTTTTTRVRLVRDITTTDASNEAN